MITLKQYEKSMRADLVEYLRGRAYYPTDWDLKISRSEHVVLAMHRIETESAGADIWCAVTGGEVVGVFRLVRHDWNSSFFGIECGEVELFFSADKEASQALVEKLNELIAQRKMEHVYIALEVRERWASLAMQKNNWRVTWACMKVVCEPDKVDASGFPPERGAWKVVEHHPDHLPHLIEIAEKITDFSWLQWEEKLLLENRRTYIAEMVRNCCTTDFSNLNYTLLDSGRPIAHISSVALEYPPGVTPTKWAFRRNLIVDPDLQSRGAGAFLAGAVLRFDQARFDLLLGRVRVEGAAMFRMLEKIGFHTRSGELYLVYDG